MQQNLICTRVIHVLLNHTDGPFSYLSSHHSPSPLPLATSIQLTPPHTIPHYHFSSLPSPLFTPLPPYPTTSHYSPHPLTTSSHHSPQYSPLPLTTLFTTPPHHTSSPLPSSPTFLTTPPHHPSHPSPLLPATLKSDIITPKDS